MGRAGRSTADTSADAADGKSEPFDLPWVPCGYRALPLADLWEGTLTTRAGRQEARSPARGYDSDVNDVPAEIAVTEAAATAPATKTCSSDT